MGGWPPLVICFQHYYDKEAILNRADMLERSGILVIILLILKLLTQIRLKSQSSDMKLSSIFMSFNSIASIKIFISVASNFEP